MQYLLLINIDEGGSATDTELAAMRAEYMKLSEDPGIRGGAQLAPSATATTVRVRDGRTLTTDGPFAETKETIGGYYLLEADNLDDAIGFAARIPGARTGAIEVRPLVEMS